MSVDDDAGVECVCCLCCFGDCVCSSSGVLFSPLGDCICLGVIVPVVALWLVSVECMGDTVFGVSIVDIVRPVLTGVMFDGGSGGEDFCGCEMLECTGDGANDDLDLSVCIGVRCCRCGGLGGGGRPVEFVCIGVTTLVSLDIMDMLSPPPDGIDWSSASNGMSNGTAATGPGGSAARCGTSSSNARTGATCSSSTPNNLIQHTS